MLIGRVDRAAIASFSSLTLSMAPEVALSPPQRSTVAMASRALARMAFPSAPPHAAPAGTNTHTDTQTQTQTQAINISKNKRIN